MGRTGVSIRGTTKIVCRPDRKQQIAPVMAEHAKVDIGAWQIWNPVAFDIDAIGANHLRHEWIGSPRGLSRICSSCKRTLGTAEFCPHDRTAPPPGVCHATTSYRTGAR
jgi:hypothetical protein